MKECNSVRLSDLAWHHHRAVFVGVQTAGTRRTLLRVRPVAEGK